jgi:hypothetical protein
MLSAAPVTGTAAAPARDPLAGSAAPARDPLVGTAEAATPALSVAVVDVVVVCVAGGAGLPAELAASPASFTGAGVAAGVRPVATPDALWVVPRSTPPSREQFVSPLSASPQPGSRVSLPVG